MNENPFDNSRRRFIIRLSGLAAAGLALPSLITSCGDGTAKETKKENKLADKQREGKLGIALVGLGKYSKGQLAPALQETGLCYLAGVVTGSPDKAREWKGKYNLPERNIYDYDNFDTIKDNSSIQIVYVVLPNALHADFVVRAARAGKHVICEKPMATSVEDCDRMIAACKEAGVMLSIGYRLHFEPYNREMMRFGKQKVYGDVQKVVANNGMSSTEGWRLDRKLAGGGPLMDVGIYCVQAARYVTGMEPIAVKAQQGVKTKPDMFKDIEESLTWQMEFPGGVTANCECSYTREMNLLRADATKGWFELSPAYAYSGIKGKTSDLEMDFPAVNQQAAQMDDFALAIRDKRATPVPGEMGRQDVKILQAIYKAMESGDRVSIS
jgi:predicted dehydrogenase